jgi:hypothetical protein
MLIGFVHNVLLLGTFDFSYNANIHTPGSPWDACIIMVPVIGVVAAAWGWQGTSRPKLNAMASRPRIRRRTSETGLTVVFQTWLAGLGHGLGR